MNQTNNHVREEIFEKIIALANRNLSEKQANLVIKFVKQYYSNVAIEDLVKRPIDTNLYGAMFAHWQLLEQRMPGKGKLRIYNPNYELHGWQSPHTIVELVTDDMPFLVDSMRMEIIRAGFNIHFTIHLGNLKVCRDAQGDVTEILPVNSTANDCSAEAVVYMEIDRESDAAVLETLQANLMRVLADVRVAVEDWGRMKQRMHDALDELEQNPPPFDHADIAEAKDFLNWLCNDHFTFLGCRDYELIGEGENQVLKIISGTGLGVLRDESKSNAERPLSSLPAAARQVAMEPHVLVISKTNTKATVHRPAYTDYIGVKRFDKSGKIIGEHRFIGLYTSTAYHSHPQAIPFLRRKVNIVMENSKFSRSGHSGKALMDILASLPRDDLFQADTDELTRLAMGVLHIQERQQIRLFVRQDAYGRFVSCLVYVPRERFNTELRQEIEAILLTAFDGLEISFSPLFSESLLARVHFLIRTDPKKELHYSVNDIEAKIVEAARSWKDELRTQLIEHDGEEKGTMLANKYVDAFSAGYRDYFPVATAIYDIGHMEKLSPTHPLEMNFYHPLNETGGNIRLKVYQPDNPFVLSDALPMLENMGLRVLDEWPEGINFKNGKRNWINNFGMVHESGAELNVDEVKEIFQDAFTRVWSGEAENDGFNRLILAAQMTWREAALLRAYTKYLRQIGFTFSQNYVETTLAKNANIAKQLVELFKLLFDPTKQNQSAAGIPALEKELQIALDAVANLDEDRILRRLLEVLRATLRTNYFQVDASGQSKPWISFKLNPSRIGELPLPRPLYEVFVYSPHVEAVHLRAAKVARGGIRWSDRREDFRTEILGLMKAQQVKNAVIVPSGAKGGFVVKRIPVDATREMIMEEVIFCYKTFMRGLLDITDNLVAGDVVPPNNTVRYDEDDPYLVVAADKGTATFSDIANSISAEYNFWLGDAFASGGSAGYDHKKMGITARGAWESVKRHFRSLNIDTQTQDFTVVGIGDMAGDVFGNGMLLSRHIKLVGAFNHANIFLDPNPNAEISFLERERLFNLPRSTWEDYNPSLISQGGGVFKRSAKTILLSPEVKQLLGLTQDTIEPNALIRALLMAKVDLLWNGGIGTYVKATDERHVDVGDRANDALRVNGNQLQCRVVGEGGNLGFTQLGRVEYALKGGLIYTDFIDNSAGVDCSDHEVNCKILLNAVVSDGDLTLKQRNEFLAEMTTEVGDLVLHDNYCQTRAISLAAVQVQTPSILALYQRYIDELNRNGKLDRALEFLPDDKVFMERKAAGKSLTTPEIAIVFAYAKILSKAELLQSTALNDLFLGQAMELAFPKPLTQRFRTYLEQHRLRPEIIATQLVNNLINDMGPIFVYRIQNETSADVATIVRAYVVASKVFAMSDLIKMIEDLSADISSELLNKMMMQVGRLVRRATRWFIRNRKNALQDIAETIKLFTQGIAALNGNLQHLLSGEACEEWKKTALEYQEAGVPEKTAARMVSVEYEYAVLDIIEAASKYEYPIQDVASLYFALGDHLEFSWLRNQIVQQAVESHWDSLVRIALLDDLDTQQRKLTIAVFQSAAKTTKPTAQLDKWMSQHKQFTTRWQRLLSELRASTEFKTIMFVMIVRELVEVVREEKLIAKTKKAVSKKKF